jgi:hypothetical protein
MNEQVFISQQRWVNVGRGDLARTVVYTGARAGEGKERKSGVGFLIFHLGADHWRLLTLFSQDGREGLCRVSAGPGNRDNG